MIVNGAILLLLRSFGAAMLIIANKNYFIAYMAGDVALYLAQKALRISRRGIRTRRERA